MKILLIGNPISGGGYAARVIRRLERLLLARGHLVKAVLAKEKHETQQCVRNVSPDDIDRLVVVGGDGTLNQVINSLSDPSVVPLAQFPAGTANLLIRELRLPWKPKPFVELLESGQTRLLDMGICNGQRFLMVASVGIDAAIVEEVHHRRAGPLGMRKYIYPILTVSGRWDTPKVNVTVDSNRVTGALVIVGNIRTYGGLFWVADRAKPDSGHLDVVVLPNDSKWALVHYAFVGLRGTLSKLPQVQYLTGKKIRIEADRPVPLQIDGDVIGTTPVDIEIQPRRVSFMCPEQ